MAGWCPACTLSEHSLMGNRLSDAKRVKYVCRPFLLEPFFKGGVLSVVVHSILKDAKKPLFRRAAVQMHIDFLHC